MRDIKYKSIRLKIKNMETFEVIGQIFLALLVCLLGFIGMLMVIKKEDVLLKLVPVKKQD